VDIDDLGLIRLFSKWSSSIVGTRIILNHATGKPKGFAFLKFSNLEDAEDAVEEMDGEMMPDGRRLVVRLNVDKDEKEGWGAGPGAQAPMTADEKMRLDRKMNEAQLRKIMSAAPPQYQRLMEGHAVPLEPVAKRARTNERGPVTLFISGYPPMWTERELVELVAPIAPVQGIRLLRNNCFVDIERVDLAAMVILKLHNLRIGSDHTIRCNWGKPST
jgi:nucleolysin TIA-1/TIAR